MFSAADQSPFGDLPRATEAEGVPWDQFYSDGRWNQEATEEIEALASKYAMRTVLERSNGYLEPTDAHLKAILRFDVEGFSKKKLEALRQAYFGTYPRPTGRKVPNAKVKAHSGSRK